MIVPLSSSAICLCIKPGSSHFRLHKLASPRINNGFFSFAALSIWLVGIFNVSSCLYDGLGVKVLIIKKAALKLGNEGSWIH